MSTIGFNGMVHGQDDLIIFVSDEDLFNPVQQVFPVLDFTSAIDVFFFTPIVQPPLRINKYND